MRVRDRLKNAGDIQASAVIKNRAYNSEGRCPSRENRPYAVRFLRRSGSVPDHNPVFPELIGPCGLRPRFPHSSVIAWVVRVSSLPPTRSQSSGCGTSFVPDSLDGHSRLSPSWKISLPLYSRIGFSTEGLPVESASMFVPIRDASLAMIQVQRTYKHGLQPSIMEYVQASEGTR